MQATITGVRAAVEQKENVEFASALGTYSVTSILGMVDASDGSGGGRRRHVAEGPRLDAEWFERYAICLAPVPITAAHRRAHFLSTAQRATTFQ